MSTIITLRYLKIWAGLSKSGTSITSSKMVIIKRIKYFLGYIPAGPLGLTGGYLRAGAIGAQMNQMQDLHS
jgi:hypothetical protein